MVTFSHDGPGTDEQLWRQLGGLDKLKPLEGQVPQNIVILAAHPDDETLGAGGLMAHVAASGAQVDVVVATAGEASHPHSPTLAPQQLAGLRAREVRAAVRTLAPDARLHVLGLPDGRLVDHVSQLAEILRGLLTEGCWLVAPWRRDAHPDHEAAGHAAASALSTGIRLLEYPVWLWHWAEPGDERVPWARLRSLRLSADERRAKVEAMSAHVSQVRPLSPQPGDEALLGPGVLAHFERDIEVFFVDEGSTGERA